MKQIEVTESGCNPTVFDLDEFLKAQTRDAQNNHIMPEDGGMEDAEIDFLRNLGIGESMTIGESDAALTIVRLED